MPAVTQSITLYIKYKDTKYEKNECEIIYQSTFYIYVWR